MRAGVGVRVGLQNLFNDNSEKAKLLAFQMVRLSIMLSNMLTISYLEL